MGRGGERTVSQCRVEFRVLEESQDLKFSYQEITFWKTNIPDFDLTLTKMG